LQIELAPTDLKKVVRAEFAMITEE
ncbi:Cys-tRNA(Pro) deacylase, partial [Escherichia coli]|nr:Cys-tRNA(Pro) deacylase [Escherichia coli]